MRLSAIISQPHSNIPVHINKQSVVKCFTLSVSLYVFEEEKKDENAIRIPIFELSIRMYTLYIKRQGLLARVRSERNPGKRIQHIKCSIVRVVRIVN